MEGEGWVDAENLEIGDDIRRADGTTGAVEAIEFEETTQEMYNLTVGTAHTFYMGEGQWLVHNACDFGNLDEIYQAAVQYPNAKYAVLGHGIHPSVAHKYSYQSYEILAANKKYTHLNLFDYDGFMKYYGPNKVKTAWWEGVNYPFLKKEIALPRKTVILSTPLKIISDYPARISYQEVYDVLMHEFGYKHVYGKYLIPPTLK